MSQSRGRPLRLSHADIVRWHEHLLITETCHVWMGAVGSDGYGRFQITNKFDGTRMLTPHQVAARLGFGPIPEGATLLHDCEVRLCCRYGTGHVGVGTQSANMRHAVARGRAVGPRPGRTDVRGKVGASRAVQAAMRDTVDRSPATLPRVLAAVIADGDPMRDLLPLFDAPVTLHAVPVADREQPTIHADRQEEGAAYPDQRHRNPTMSSRSRSSRLTAGSPVLLISGSIVAALSHGG